MQAKNGLTDHSTSLMIGNGTTGQWIRDSSTDNPGYIATIVRDWLGDWSKAPKYGSYAQKPPLPEYVKDKGIAGIEIVSLDMRISEAGVKVPNRSTCARRDQAGKKQE